ncbi:MAG: histidine--tRNA ligase [Planctomycetota bacterium]|jgi:histidyl-tRNA synthetase
MKIPPVKGTRDFYPTDMARRNWIIDGWKKVSVRNGFEEYDGPIFEYLKMFQIKSGDEIVDQLFSFKDRGGRDLALRPEITPTLARMVNQQINSLPKPIKWFSVPRLFRAERPQKGRLREFFQWNIDIIGIDDVLADAEVIFCALDYLREVGLTPDDIVVKISSRKMLAALLQSIGIPKDGLEPLYAVLDKRSKLSLEAFEETVNKQVSDLNTTEKILQFMELDVVYKISGMVDPNPELDAAIKELSDLLDWLNQMGVGDYCVFGPSIVRGLAYYTGVVYEIYDKASELRAVGGGGRYDNLLRDFGGPDIPATGLAIGDCVLGILLEEKGLCKPEPSELDYFVAFVDEAYRQNAIKLTMKLRSAGLAANFSYKAAKLSRQLKEASDRNAPKCIIIGEEFKNSQLVIKDMMTGEQELVDYDEFWSRLEA